MPCNAFSAVDLRSWSIQETSRSMTCCCAVEIKSASFAASCSQCCTSGSSAWVTTNAGRRSRAYGKSTSLTNVIELVVPSMSVRMVVVMIGSPLPEGVGYCFPTDLSVAVARSFDIRSVRTFDRTLGIEWCGEAREDHRTLAAAGQHDVAETEQAAPCALVQVDRFDRGETQFLGRATDDAGLADDAAVGYALFDRAQAQPFV